MPVQALAADTALALHDIQGDILIGLQKDAEDFIFFEILDPAAFLKTISGPDFLVHVTSAELAAQREAELEAHEGGGRPLLFLGLNLGFTAKGLRKLRPDDELDGLDPSFVSGALTQAAKIHDDPAAYLPPFRAETIDGVLLVTGPTPLTSRDHGDALVHVLRHVIRVVHREQGRTRPRPFRGHEHFGFADGISQPGIRTLTAQQNPDDPEQGLPGQDLIHPGEFVFGYPSQDDPFVRGEPTTKERPGPNADPPRPWMLNGSYMVFRRLEQKVLAFDAFLAANAGPAGADLLGAKLVGRWKSGAPIVLSPHADDPDLGRDKTRNNDFEFEDDPKQLACPYAGHIRKTYPRDDLNSPKWGPPGVDLDLLEDESGEASVQTHRIRRAGIPFGPELYQDEALGNFEAVGREASRGLMFVCYQTSIEEQFEFMQSAWCNNPGFVFGKVDDAGQQVTPGFDLIIGQAAGDRFINMPGGKLTAHPPAFVTATASSYFFMPSLSALRAGLK